MNYIEQALRTNSNTVGTHGVPVDLIHAALGLADESNEITLACNAQDLENLIEELGDFCWFVALAGHALNHDPFSARSDSPLESHTAPPLLVGTFIGLVKKSYAYGKPLPVTELTILLDRMVVSVRAMVAVMGELSPGLAFEQILAKNIAKLRARFPDKFDAERAMHRDLAAEGAAMGATLQ